MKTPKLLFIVCLLGAIVLGWCAHVYVVKQILARDCSMKIEGVEIAKLLVHGKPMFSLVSTNPSVTISWISGASNANVTGQGFVLDADICSDGSLARYHLQHGGYDYFDLNCDGDADVRCVGKLSKDLREIRIDGVWHKAASNTVTIDGKTYDVQWKDGWKVKQ
ncbi:MAG: hypothetical protein WC440_05600 [Candidatus Omnitrophota bacterium]|jgi:hypothetical protein